MCVFCTHDKIKISEKNRVYWIQWSFEIIQFRRLTRNITQLNIRYSELLHDELLYSVVFYSKSNFFAETSGYCTQRVNRNKNSERFGFVTANKIRLEIEAEIEKQLLNLKT